MSKKLIRLTESDLHRIVKESVNRVLRESVGLSEVNKEWGPDEFVDYDEYANYGVSGDYYLKNSDRADKLGVPEEDRCPLCSKPLKDGSYKTLRTLTDPASQQTRYYFNQNAPGEPMKVGNGCFRNLTKAYKAKYGK